MSDIRIYNKNNTVYLFGQAYSAGDLTASNPSGNDITIVRDSDSKVLVRAVTYTKIKDKSNAVWGNSVQTALVALNNYLGNSNPDKIIPADNTNLFNNAKEGYTVVVGDSDNITSSSKLLFANHANLKLGADLDVSFKKLYTTFVNGDITLEPNGTGSINLDGTIQFKRFDAGATAPSAFTGGMYADDDDNLYFGVTGA